MMIEYFKLAMNKYADFSGRSTRSEFWYFYLAYLLIALALGVILGVGLATESQILIWIAGGLLVIFALGCLVPSLAAMVRRLHDTGRSGWWYFISLIPYVGSFVLIYFLAQPTKEGTNQWGPEPGTNGDSLEDALVNFD